MLTARSTLSAKKSNHIIEMISNEKTFALFANKVIRNGSCSCVVKEKKLDHEFR